MVIKPGWKNWVGRRGEFANAKINGQQTDSESSRSLIRSFRAVIERCAWTFANVCPARKCGIKGSISPSWSTRLAFNSTTTLRKPQKLHESCFSRVCDVSILKEHRKIIRRKLGLNRCYRGHSLTKVDNLGVVEWGIIWTHAFQMFSWSSN